MKNSPTPKPKPALLSGREAIQSVRAHSDTVLLAFSTGKDSLTCWLRLRKHFARVIPFYMAEIPGLQFVERTLQMYERYFETPILRTLHPLTLQWLNEYIYAAPGQPEVIYRAQFDSYTYDQLFASVKQHLGLPAETYVALGQRALDSTFILLEIRDHGAVNPARRVFYPIWDITKARQVVELRRGRIPLSEDYRIFGRSYDGLHRQFTAKMKEHYPDDYARLRELFPLAEADLWRWDYAQRRYAAQPGA